MNILMIHDVGYVAGGAEVLLLGIRRELEGRGHVVKVLSRRHAGNTFSEYEFACVDRNRFGKSFSYLYNPFSALKLRAIIRDFRPDVVHLHTIEKASPSILPLLRRVPTVLSVHDYGLFYPGLKETLPDGAACLGAAGACCFEHAGYRLYWEVLRMKAYVLLLGSVDRIIPNSVFMRDILRRVGFERVSDVSRIGTTLFEPSVDGFERHSVLSVGRMEKEKGIGYLIEAMRLVVSEFPDARLTVVGSGSELGNLRRLTADFGLERNVRFVSDVSNREVGGYYRRSAVVVVPSVWPEPFGMVGVEAMSVGRPVIASRVGGIPEWLRDGENGILVEPARPRQIADAIRRLFLDEAGYRTMSENALHDATAYGMSRYVEDLLGEYEGVMGGAGRGGVTGTPVDTLKRIWGDSLYRNSLYLVMSSVILSGLGFLFWMLNTHLFDADQIGIATTLITTMTLIANFSMLGLNVSLVKFLPKSERKMEKINSVFVITGSFSLVVSAAYVSGFARFTPELSFLQGNAFFLAVFMAATVGTSLHRVIESVFIAFRDTAHILAKNVIFSLGKLAFPIFLVSLASIGILLSWAAALLLSFAYCVVILYRRYGYRFRSAVNMDIVRGMVPYSAGNYVADFLTTLPMLVLPLIITSAIGAERTAFFYVTFMIAGFLFIIPESLGHSLFAEGSHDEGTMRRETSKAVTGSLLVLIPGIAFVLLLGDLLLLLFGSRYSAEGSRLLRILSLSAVPYTFNSIFGSILKIRQEIGWLIAASLVGSVSILTLCVLSLPAGLAGVGVAWGAGQTVLFAFYCLLMIFRNPFRKNVRSREESGPAVAEPD